MAQRGFFAPLKKKTYDVDVVLMAITEPVVHTGLPLIDDTMVPGADVEDVLEWASRLCVDKLDDLGSRQSYIQDRIQQGHESVIEHGSMTFYVRCSRILTHELVRHRLASYSQRSQRYVREGEMRFITPPELMFPDLETAGIPHMQSDDVQTMLAERFIQHMTACWDLYAFYLHHGVKPEIARYVLPGACETQIVCTFNFRELRHIIRLRTSIRALPEMRVVARKVRNICKEHVPRVFEDIE